MTVLPRLVGLTVACAMASASVNAQTSSTPPSDPATRPAFTTAEGDTGLWYVPTAEVLAKGKWSASGYRVSLNYVQGFSNVADFPLTFAVGVAPHVEVFGSFKAITRIDRDIRPLFQADPDVGGVIGRYPFDWQTWTGSRPGDLVVGAKFNVLSQERQQPAALAVRGSVKIPTGDKDAGVSTGKADGFLDLVVSREMAGIAEISGTAGGAFRSNADNVTQSKGVRWGVGAGFPSRSPLRFTAEVNGEKPFDDTITIAAPIVASDQSRAFGNYTLHNFTAATLGLTLQLPNGFFAGIGMTKTLPSKARGTFGADSDPSVDYVDYQIRIGYHPGVRRYAAAPPPLPLPPSPPQEPSPPPPAPAISSPPSTPPGGAGTGGAGGAGGAAPSGVIAAPIVELRFEDVYFDFDRSSLRAEALRLLDDAVAKMQANPEKTLIIEGHTCNIGTAEYNLALGERRARAVQTYLTSRGIPASRLETRSYGEEQPKFDNGREETRRLNRRAALVIKVQ